MAAKRLTQEERDQRRLAEMKKSLAFIERELEKDHRRKSDLNTLADVRVELETGLPKAPAAPWDF